ncbi:MAG: hypothetical protein LH474_03900 [Chamaesiphon sp.]|nr:hypothetical protein [Chamaesiphon sp.]
MSIKLVHYDLINRRPETLVHNGAIRAEIIDNMPIERLMLRQGLLQPDEQPIFYSATYSKFISLDDLTSQAPEGTVLIATSNKQVHFGSPEAKAAIKSLMPLATQIPGYARGLLTPGKSPGFAGKLRVLVVNDKTGANNLNLPPKLIKNIVADGSSVVSRQLGEEVGLIPERGLPQVRGYSVDPQIGNFYIKGTFTPLNIPEYFASHGLDLDVDLILTTSMLKGVTKDKPLPAPGMYEVDAADLYITQTKKFQKTTAKLGTVSNFYAQGLAKDIAIPTQNAIQDLEQKKLDIISLAEDYVRTFELANEETARKNDEPCAPLPGNIAFIESILESKNWGLLELPSVLSYLNEYANSQVESIDEGAIANLRGEYRPLIICGDLQHNQVAGAGLTTGDKHIAMRFPVLNRGQVQAVTVNNDIPLFQNPALGGVIPDAIYVGRETLADIQENDPARYQEIISEFGSEEAARSQWRSNLEAMKADFDGDEIAIFPERTYPNFYAEVVENLKPELLMNFVSKDEKQLIENNNLAEMVVERLKPYVNVINKQLTGINELYAAIDFIITSDDRQLKVDTAKAIHQAWAQNKGKDTTESIVEIDVTLDTVIPLELAAVLDESPFFSSTDFLKEVDNIRSQVSYLAQAKMNLKGLLSAGMQGNLVATPVNAKKGIIFPAELKSAIDKFNHTSVAGFTKGERDPELLKQYLDDYNQIYAGLSQVIDFSKPISEEYSWNDPITNEDVNEVKPISLQPNLPYDPTQIDTYLRHYQTVVLKEAIGLVDKQNQRAVDFVKSGVKPDEGAVVAVTQVLPKLKVGIPQLKQIIIAANQQNHLPSGSTQSLNALLGEFRSATVAPELNSVVAYYRSQYQELQDKLYVNTKDLKEFKYGKPLVLGISTESGTTISIGRCNHEEVALFRQSGGMGAISESVNGTIVYHPDPATGLKDGRICLGALTASSQRLTEVMNPEQIIGSEYIILHDREKELQSESRQVLANFRSEVEQRGWDKKQVFAAVAKLAGEKAVSQKFLTDCLPETMREFVQEMGLKNILVKTSTQTAQMLSEPTQYVATNSADGSKQLKAFVPINGKSQWVEVGNLEAYGNQLTHNTTFQGTIEAHYNQVQFSTPASTGSAKTLTVGKITPAGRELIDRPDPIQNLSVVRQQTAKFILTVGDKDIEILDLSPTLSAQLAKLATTELTLSDLRVYDTSFVATTEIDGKTQYLSGANFDPLNKKNRDNTKDVTKENLSQVKVTVTRSAEATVVYEVRTQDVKLGEITQKPSLNFWENQFEKLTDKSAIEINFPVSKVEPKYSSYRVNIDPKTVYNTSVWMNTEPAQTYLQSGAKEQSDKLDARVRSTAKNNLRQSAEALCFHPSFTAKTTVTIVDEAGVRAVERLKLVVPDNKIAKLEGYLKSKAVPYIKLDKGLPATYEESRRGYHVLRVDPADLTPQFKTQLSKQLGKPIEQSEYEAKLQSIPITRERVNVKLNSFRNFLTNHPPTNPVREIDLAAAKRVPYALQSVTGEVETRFRGKASLVDDRVVFEFVNDRQRNTAAYHLGLTDLVDLVETDAKTRYLAAVEVDKIRTYLNDRAVGHVSIKDGVKLDHPIVATYATTKDWTKLGARSQLDIAIGYQATKYIGVPLIEKSQTANYRASWGAKANCTSYSASDVVMVTGNRSSNQLGQELLKQHFEREYKPLLDAAVKAGAKILCGNDGDTDDLTRQYLTELGSDLHLNSAGYYEATSQVPASVVQAAPVAQRINLVQPSQSSQECEPEMSLGG